MTETDGPHVNAAFVCERVLTEQDGVASIIRIVDRVNFTADSDGNPVDPTFPLVLFVNLKSGAARGSFTIKLEMEKPSTERQSLLEAPVLFEGEERGANIVFQMMFEPEMPGLYWFDVLLDGQRLTRVPLRAIFQAQPTIGPGG